MNWIGTIAATIKRQEEDATKRSADPVALGGDKEVRLAVSYIRWLKMLDWVPLPRTVVLGIALYYNMQASQRFKELNHDEYGFGGGTFCEVSSDLWCLFPLAVLVDITLLMLIV